MELRAQSPRTRDIAPGRWARIIPLAFVTYSLAYLDRSNYGFGAAAGLAKTLGITASASALLGALFFLGYFIFQIPGAHYAETRSAKKIIVAALICWGVLASLTGILTNIYALYVDRFLLGVVESVILPAMLVFLTHWFTSGERSRANTFLILGNPVTVLWMSLISGFLILAVGWQWMFIIEGIPSIIWAFVFLKFASDRPRDAAWLPRESAETLEAQLAAEQTGITPLKNYWVAFRTMRVILLSLQYAFWSIGVYGFVIWLPSIIKSSSHYGIGITGVLTALPYLLAIALMLLASYFSDQTRERKLFVWPFLLAGAIAFYISFLAGPANFWLAFIMLVIAGGCMYAPYGPFFAIMPDILPRNVSGESMALVNAFGALGSFVGALVVGWLNGNTGSNQAGFIFMAICLVIAVVLTIAVRMGQPAASRPPEIEREAELDRSAAPTA